jgi:TRAP-type C4-dicarboxylate transport system permease small subunit
MDPVKAAPPRRGLLFFVGATGLVGLMVIGCVAVIGRHVRWPLLGALELAQVAIVPAACASMIIAALANAHATVHLVTDRLPARLRRVTARVSALLAGLFFGGLAVATGWLAFDFWNSFEETDVLHIPFRPLRVLVAACAAALALIFLRRALRRERES